MIICRTESSYKWEHYVNTLKKTLFVVLYIFLALKFMFTKRSRYKIRQNEHKTRPINLHVFGVVI